jgi:hypothetical protein
MGGFMSYLDIRQDSDERSDRRKTSTYTGQHNTERQGTNIHTLSGIRTHDSCVPAIKTFYTLIGKNIIRWLARLEKCTSTQVNIIIYSVWRISPLLADVTARDEAWRASLEFQCTPKSTLFNFVEKSAFSVCTNEAPNLFCQYHQFETWTTRLLWAPLLPSWEWNRYKAMWAI